MTIVFSCDCGREIRTTDRSAGNRGSCPSCGAELVVPSSMSDQMLDSESTLMPRPQVAQPEASLSSSSTKQRRPLSVGSVLFSIVLLLFGSFCLLSGVMQLLTPTSPQTASVSLSIAGFFLVLGAALIGRVIYYFVKR
jgi:hypothetical protein